MTHPEPAAAPAEPLVGDEMLALWDRDVNDGRKDHEPGTNAWAARILVRSLKHARATLRAQADEVAALCQLAKELTDAIDEGRPHTNKVVRLQAAIANTAAAARSHRAAYEAAIGIVQGVLNRLALDPQRVVGE